MKDGGLASPCGASPPDDRRRGIHRVTICRVARGKWPSRRTVLRKAALARPPEPTNGASAERLQPAVGVEYLDARSGLLMDVKERLTSGVGSHRRRPHAAISAGSARTNPRR